jgi:hypothetical protein
LKEYKKEKPAPLVIRSFKMSQKKIDEIYEINSCFSSFVRDAIDEYIAKYQKIHKDLGI